MNIPLSSDAINHALTSLSGWQFSDDRLSKQYKFKNFRQALAFIVRISFEIEALNHHPEIHNVYGRVTIHLNTHDCGNKVTEKDVTLAQKIEALAASFV